MDNLINHGDENDIKGRAEIDLLMDTFYSEVRQNTTLGPIFDDVAQVDWETHIPKLASFWETVLFRSGGYRGNPLAEHANLLGRVDLNRDTFDTWLELFNQSVDKLFTGPNAEHIKRCADDMANVIHRKLQAKVLGEEV